MNFKPCSKMLLTQTCLSIKPNLDLKILIFVYKRTNQVDKTAKYWFQMTKLEWKLYLPMKKEGAF